ncbi:MAG: hypothetical protein Q8N47_19035, partial [Bryobacterales bacterium]|nr:hypothetical protein [Bryobacterales bacterium]
MGEIFLWSDATQSLDAGEGAPDDVLEAGFVTLEEEVEVGILAGQRSAGMEQALEVVGRGLGGEFEVDSLAFDGPEAVETPSGGADFLDRGLLDGVARGDAVHVLADQFLEALARLLLDDGGFGKLVVKEGLGGGAELAVRGFGAAGEGSVGAGGGFLSGRSHVCVLRVLFHWSADHGWGTRLRATLSAPFRKGSPECPPSFLSPLFLSNNILVDLEMRI